MSSPPGSFDSEWKQLRLSFERPYKDDSGNRIPVLYDLTPEGERIYEPKETPFARLESNLRRIFIERGSDFFERRDHPLRKEGDQGVNGEISQGGLDEGGSTSKVMTVEELYALRMEIMPQLFIALGEMSHARDLLNSVLTAPQTAAQESQVEQPKLLSATLVTKPAPIVSVQAFNAQLTIGSKDEALRKAASLFRSSAESMERGRLKGERYWVDALRIRRANWALTPAPLPYGSPTGKGADKTSKDFLISYGLEGSPSSFRRRAIAQLTTLNGSAPDIVLPFHQNTRLRITTLTISTTVPEICVFDSARHHDALNLDKALRVAQTEIVDQEIFSLLVKEAGNLPTASAQVSERLIVIGAAQGLDLTFELVDSVAVHPCASNAGTVENVCELVYYALRVLLLRRQRSLLVENRTSSSRTAEALILRPIIDALQYQVFCVRIEVELRKAVTALNAAGIPSTLYFTPVGEAGQLLVSLFSEQHNKAVSGEAVIRIDDWHTLRFTFTSPSTLTAHLSQATLTISSLPHLSQLLMDEIERSLLQKICAVGREGSLKAGGIWFVDLDRCVAKWEGCVLNFRILYGKEFGIGCCAFRLNNTTAKQGVTDMYTPGDGPLVQWAIEVINKV